MAMRIPVLFALASLLASSSRAQGQDPELLLHARSIPSLKDLARVDEAPAVDPFIPGCASKDKLSVPLKYEELYRIPSKDMQKLQGMLAVAQKYSDRSKALADRYLPVDMYEDGYGLGLARPDLFTDRKYDLKKPDLLFYIKRRGQEEYRLVGMAFVAGPAQPPKDFLVTRKNSKELMKLWRPWDGICFTTKKGILSYHDAEDGKADCAGGTFIQKAWVMHVWLPLYNPLGLFTPRNPVVDHYDLNDKQFPFCSKMVGD